MKKLFAILAVQLGVIGAAVSPVSAQPDSRDSIIIESKTVLAGVGTPAVYVRVFITNKDSITSLVLSLVERSLSGGAYMTLSWPRTFNGVVRRLTTTLQGVTGVNTQRYNGISPDTFVVASFYEATDQSLEPPNLVRKAFWEIKFDTVFSMPEPSSWIPRWL